MKLLLLKSAFNCAWTATEFMLVETDGSVFTAIVANFNRIGSLLVSPIVFGNPVTPMQYAGFGLTLIGAMMNTTNKEEELKAAKTATALKGLVRAHPASKA